MPNPSFLRVLAAFACLCVASASGAAVAQTLLQPPKISEVDGNGVDLVTGKYQMPDLNVSIGSENSGIARVANEGSDNYVGVISMELVPYTYGVAYGSFYWNVSYAGRVYRFHVGGTGPNGGPGAGMSYIPGPYNSGGPNKAQLVCSGNYVGFYYDSGGACTLTLQDGTTVSYYNRPGQAAIGAWIQQITKPDGEVITLNYYKDTSGTVKAIKSAASSLGWMLHYQVDANYAITQISALNTAKTYCDPAASSCSVSGYPSASKSVSGSTTTISRNGATLASYTTGTGTTTITSPTGVTRTLSIDGSGRVTGFTIGGSTWHYAYSTDSSGNSTTTVTAPNGTTHSLVSTYDYKITSVTDEAGRKTQYIYDGYNVKYVVAPDGSQSTGGFTLYTYDLRNNVTSVSIVPKGGATNGVPNVGAALVSSATYSSTCPNVKTCNKPLTTTDANGVATTYTYDASSGNVSTITLPAVNGVAPQTRYNYSQITPYILNSSGGQVAQPPVWRLTSMSSCRTTSSCSGGSDERKMLINYGSDNTHPVNPNILPVSTTTEIGNGTYPQTTTFVAYDNNGNATTINGPKGSSQDTYIFYDSLNRKMGTIGPDPDGTGSRHRSATKTIYNADGRVAEVDVGTASGTNATALAGMTIQARAVTNYSTSTGLSLSGYAYVGTSSSAKTVTQTSYDSMLRVDCTALRLNPVNYSSLPPSACTLGTTLPDGTQDRIVKNNYDAVTGRLLSTVSAYGTTAAATDASYVYDISGATSTGNLLSASDANGNKTSYFYDTFNRLVKVCFPTPGNGAVTDTSDCTQTAYRATSVTGASQTTSLIDHAILRDGQTTYLAYDALGRVNSKSGAVSESFTYDNFSDVLTHVNNTTGGASASESYNYNALGWLLSDTQPMGTVSYSYDAYGRRNALGYPGSFIVYYAYNNNDELTGESGPNTTVHFNYDDYGRRTSLTRGNGVTTNYGYDANLRLGTLTQGASGASFYNQVSYGYNNADQIISKAGTNPSYDYAATANSISYGIDGLNRIGTINSTSMSYDARGNLSSDGSATYTYNANNLLTGVSAGATLRYDAENRLLVVDTPSTAERKFLYDGTDLIAEYDSNGNVVARYIHSPGDDEPLVWYDGSGTSNYYYLHADDNGSVTLITNGSGGQYAINAYDGYGLPESGNVGRFQYTGQVWLPEIGMYYYKARLYNPVIGRFLQTDPSGYSDGMNWYSYVHGDPINLADANGLCAGADYGGCPEYGDSPTQGSGCHDGCDTMDFTDGDYSYPLYSIRVDYKDGSYGSFNTNDSRYGNILGNFDSVSIHLNSTPNINGTMAYGYLDYISFTKGPVDFRVYDNNSHYAPGLQVFAEYAGDQSNKWWGQKVTTTLESRHWDHDRHSYCADDYFCNGRKYQMFQDFPDAHGYDPYVFKADLYLFQHGVIGPVWSGHYNFSISHGKFSFGKSS